MTYLAKPRIHHPSLPKNALGFTHRDYEGAISTLCAGCGHDSISSAIIQAFFELDGIYLDQMRLRGFPFADAVPEFIAAHDRVFVVEQNRDAQMKSLLVNECGVDPARFISVLHYDGTPITARFIAGAIGERLDALKITPLRRVGA